MQNKISVAGSNDFDKALTEHINRYQVATGLDAVKSHLQGTGKVCLRPWCWQRFYILYNPGMEPPWLSSWWSTTTQEKKALFLQQLEYLAMRTDRFPDAWRFLQGMGNEHWLHERRVTGCQTEENRIA